MLSSLRNFSKQGYQVLKQQKCIEYSQLNLPEDVLQVQNVCRNFAKEVLAPQASMVDRENKFPHKQIDQLGQLGLLSICLPKQWGGSEMNTLALAVAVEELSQGCASTGAIVSIYNCLYVNLINQFGTDDQIGEFLKPYTQKVGGCFALSEPDAGSDVASLRTTAHKSGDKYIINGTKSWVTSGNISQNAIIFATIDRKTKHKGIAAFIVPLQNLGVTVGPTEDKMGIRGASCCSLNLTNVEVYERNILGGHGMGFEIAMKQLQQARIGIAAQALGIAQSALDASIDYADTRLTFGKQLTGFQMVKSRIAEMAVSLEAARLLVHRAAMKYDADGAAAGGKESSMAKLAASRAANFVTHNAVQIFGGMGYVKNQGVERMFRDARVTEIYGGVTDIQKLVIADAVISERIGKGKTKN